jgi:hypothetical protein
MRKAIIIGILAVVFLKMAYNIYSFLTKTINSEIENFLKYALIASVFFALTAFSNKEKVS